MAAPKSKPDFRAAVHDLGGDDNDYDLVANIDDDGSEFEEDSASINTGKLEDDVATLWAELSNDADGAEKHAGKKNSGSRDDNAASSETSAAQRKGRQLPEKREHEPSSSQRKATKEVPGDESKSSKSEPKGTKKSDSKSSNKANGESKQKSQSSSGMQPVSKKVRKEWEQYLASLERPSDLVIADDVAWYSLTGSTQEGGEPPAAEFVAVLKEKAGRLLENENSLYFSQRSKDRDFTGSLQFLKSGTYSDQLGTLSILATESPLHSTRFIESLVSKCEIKNRESACKALEVTKDLLVSHVLPDRRLAWFKDQPLRIGATIQELIAWSFEDFLKSQFFRLLQVMERLLTDTVESIRLRTLHCAFDFFRLKPEQEANLLRLGLNKLGDPSGKIASRVKKLVMDALQLHPGMKSIVATVTSEVLSRSADYRTRYYAVDTLSEFILSSRESGLANQLVHIYLDLFERLLVESQNATDEGVDKKLPRGKPKSGKRFRAKRGKKGGISQEKKDVSEVESQQYARLVSKIFTGLNRAFPFSRLDAKFFTKYTDTLYHMSHSPNVGTFIEALSFIFQLTKSASKASDTGRYFRTLYESLLDQRLSHSSKLGKYIHLLLKSVAELRSESEVARANAFAKRMLQVAANWSEIGGTASLIHAVNHTPHTSRLLEAQLEKSEYDPRQRDPQYAKADTSQAWEILLLRSHFHPTVSLYASNLLAVEGEKQALDLPDIEQYSVNNFLSKWSYKKPKVRDTARGSSIFQPLSGFTDLNLGIRQEQGPKSQEPVQMRDWKSKDASQVAPDEQFLYDYFTQLPDKPKKPGKEDKQPKGSGDEDEDDSLDEDDVSQAMARSGPGDMGGIDIDASDMDSDGDLEDLAGAFSDSDEVEDDADNDDIDVDIEEGSQGEFEDAAELSGEDDFVDFDDFEQQSPKKDEETEGGAKKRKRQWANYPTFLDADAFEDMYTKEEQAAASKKRG